MFIKEGRKQGKKKRTKEGRGREEEKVFLLPFLKEGGKGEQKVGRKEERKEGRRKAEKISPQVYERRKERRKEGRK